VPFPANYGGVIDVFYKLVWLKKMDVRVHLHCFAYGRPPASELEALCEKVYYYPRKTGLRSFFSLLPYTVKSRQSKELEENLLRDQHPILFEVLHTCYLLNDERFKGRLKIYRHSNIEHHYYLHLAGSEKSLLKKIYLQLEAIRLKRFEKLLAKADLILAVNEIDAAYFRKKFAGIATHYIPSFHANDKLSTYQGKGDYILYHGNLSIPENYEAVEWLVENVFSKIREKVIVAGLKPPLFLKKALSAFTHIELVENPSEEKMFDLITHAQVHCLYTAQTTGLKLKLLNVLFNGRFLVCNANMLSGTGFQKNAGLLVADDFVSSLQNCLHQEFTKEHLAERQSMLENFNNEKNVKHLLAAVFNEQN
jgi:hypothetical protein